MCTRPILLVEDDENDVFFFQRAMSKAGMVHPLQVARDGQEAINYLQGGGKFARRAEVPPPCLILLDLKLPFVMGLDVLRWVRQQSRLTPIVIILSSSREDADVAAAYRLGANAYLVKPAQTSELVEMVRTINDFWLTQNTPPPNSEAGEAMEFSQAGEAMEFATDLRTQGVGGQRCPPASNTLVQVHSQNRRTDL